MGLERNEGEELMTIFGPTIPITLSHKAIVSLLKIWKPFFKMSTFFQMEQKHGG